MTDFCAGTLPIDVHTLEKTVDSSHELFHLHKRDADPLAHWLKYHPWPMDCTISSNMHVCFQGKEGEPPKFIWIPASGNHRLWRIPTNWTKNKKFPNSEFSWAISRSRTYHNFWNSPSGRHLFKRMYQLGTAKMAAPKAPNFGMTEHQQLENGAKAKSRLGKSRGCQSWFG